MKKTRVKTKPKEDKHQKITQPETSVNTRSMPDPFTMTWGTPITSDEQIGTQNDLAKTVHGGSISDNYSMLRDRPPTEPEVHVPLHIQPRQEATEPPKGEVPPYTGPKTDTSTIVPDEGENPDKSKPPAFTDTVQPEGAPDVLPKHTVTHVDVGIDPPKTKKEVPLGPPTVEQDLPAPPCPEGHHRDGEGNCVPDASATEQDDAASCPDGEHRDSETGLCVKDTVEQDDSVLCPIGQHRDPATGKCLPDTLSDASTTTEVDDPCGYGYHRNDEGDCVPDGVEQVDAEPCADGYHKNDEGNCVPDEPLDERVKRIRAETRQLIAETRSAKLQKDMRNIETIWEQRYTKLDRMHQKQQMLNHSQSKIMKQQRVNIRKEQLRCEDLRVENRELKNRHSDATRLTTKYVHLIEDMKIENADLNKKNATRLSENLTLSKQATRASEEYLDLAKVKEKLEDALKRSRINAKKTLKLRV